MDSRTLRIFETGKNPAMGVAIVDAGLDGHRGTWGQAFVDEDASECIVNPAMSIVPRCKKACCQCWWGIRVRLRLPWVDETRRKCRGVIVHVELKGILAS
jgi:hypothetical protein